MTVERLIQILQKMPKSTQVYMVDMGSDQYPYLKINSVGYTSDSGIVVVAPYKELLPAYRAELKGDSQ